MNPSLVHVVRKTVDASPERIVFTFRDLVNQKDSALTYGELWSEAEAFSEALHGIETERVVVLVLPLGPRLLSAHLGCLLSGVIPIIHSHPSAKVSPEVYLKQLGHTLTQVRPYAVISNGKYGGEISRLSNTRVIFEEDVPTSTFREATIWKGRVGKESAVIQHSSGSTGLKKGVLLTHQMILDQCESYAASIALSSQSDRICSWIPLYHDMGFFTSWLMPLIHRVPVYAVDPFSWVQNPLAFLKLISDVRGTLAWQPNFAFNLLASRYESRLLQGVHLGSLRKLISCSEPTSAESLSSFDETYKAHGLRSDALSVCYAMAENSFAVTMTSASSDFRELFFPVSSSDLTQGKCVSASEGKITELVSVGKPVPDCEVKVVDANRIELPENHVGELAVRSPFTLKSYFRDPKNSQSSIDGQGWYYTGDLGAKIREQFYVTGRKKDLLIVAGRNFYPQDIEAICDGLEGAIPGRSVALGLRDEKGFGTERIVVLMETGLRSAEKKSLLESQVRKTVLEELDCPVSEVHALPPRWLQKTSSGKIARTPNLEKLARYQQGQIRQAIRLQQLAAVGMGTLTAIVAWSLILCRPNFSWGVYAGF